MMVVTVLQLLLLSFIVKSGIAATNCAEYGDLRLVGGSTAFEGRVEVCNDMGAWNRVCSDSWDKNDAIVVCRQLGFSQVDSLAITQQDAQSSSVHTGFLFNEVNCYGLEPRLINCSIRLRYPHVVCDASGREDAGVRCTNISLIRNINASYSDTSAWLTWNPVHSGVNYFEVKCFSVYNKTTHSAQSMVSSDKLSIHLDGLAPSTLYNCCVSAVLDKHSSTTCIDVGTSSSNTSMSTEGSNGSGIIIAVGMLSFFNAVFIVLLILAAVALVYFIIIIRKQKEELKLRNLNPKVHQLEIEKNPSYSTGNAARNDFNKYRQTTNSRRGDQVDSIKRYGEIQKTRREPSNNKLPVSSQRGCSVHDKHHAAAGQKLKFEEDMEMNPSYSSVPLPGVGEYSIVEPLYEKADKKINLSTSLKITGNKRDNRASSRAKSFITSSRYAHSHQRERSDDKIAQTQQLDIESNPAYSALPGTDGEYSLVGPAYHKVSSATDTTHKTKHEYAEIKETNAESRNSLQEEYSASLTGSAYDRTGLKTDIASPIQHDDLKQPAGIDLATVKDEGDDAVPFRMDKDGIVKGESFN